MVLFYLLVLVTVTNLETLNNFNTMALRLSGDVELNPGYQLKNINTAFWASLVK